MSGRGPGIGRLVAASPALGVGVLGALPLGLRLELGLVLGGPRRDPGLLLRTGLLDRGGRVDGRLGAARGGTEADSGDGRPRARREVRVMVVVVFMAVPPVGGPWSRDR